MKHISDFIKSGLLGMLDGMNGPLFPPFGIDDEETIREETWTAPDWQARHAGGMPRQPEVKKLPCILSPHGAGEIPLPEAYNVFQPETYPEPFENPVQLLGEAYSGHTYRAGRRPLGLPILRNLYNEPGDEDGAGEDHNRRGEHQHFIGNDGRNFGLGPNGIFEEDPKRLPEYSFDIPGLEGRKMKGIYIDAARQKVERRWQEIENSLEDKNSRFKI